MKSAIARKMRPWPRLELGLRQSVKKRRQSKGPAKGLKARKGGLWSLRQASSGSEEEDTGLWSWQHGEWEETYRMRAEKAAKKSV